MSLIKIHGKDRILKEMKNIEKIPKLIFCIFFISIGIPSFPYVLINDIPVVILL